MARTVVGSYLQVGFYLQSTVGLGFHLTYKLFTTYHGPARGIFCVFSFSFFSPWCLLFLRFLARLPVLASVFDIDIHKKLAPQHVTLKKRLCLKKIGKYPVFWEGTGLLVLEMFQVDGD